MRKKENGNRDFCGETDIIMKKIILITGSTDGIGKNTAKILASQGHKIILHGRSEDKCLSARKEILSENPKAEVDFASGDLSSMKQTSRLADTVMKKTGRLDVLLNNAGVFMNERKLSEDGFELSFAVNHLSHFLLTLRLLDFLKKNSGFRIVNLSSVAHRNGVFDLENLQSEKNFTGYGAYALSKLANILFTMELSDRVKGKGTVNCMHPGVIGTKLLKTGFNMSGGTLDEGSDNSVYLAVSPEVNEITGKYFVKREISPVNSKLIPKEHQKQLWEISEKLAGQFL